jgi:3-mercaptopyruvate sulfurtransferase SseA
MFGHNRVSILDGGLKKWLKEDFQIIDHPPKRTVIIKILRVISPSHMKP